MMCYFLVIPAALFYFLNLYFVYILNIDLVGWRKLSKENKRWIVAICEDKQ